MVSAFPEVNDELLGLITIQGGVVFPAPYGQVKSGGVKANMLHFEGV